MAITLTGNTVDRDGLTIGTFDPNTGIVTFSVDQPPPIKSQVKSAVFTATKLEVKGFALMEATDAGAPPPSESTGTGQAPEPPPAPSPAPSSASAPAAQAKASAIPPCPKGSIAQGDKDPAVVEWYRQYKPSEYQRRYAGRLKEVPRA